MIRTIAAVALAAALSGNVYTDASKPIAVAVGNDFLIALPSNPTTGFSWSARVSGSAVSSEGSAYQAHPSGGAMGAGGQQIFSLEAERAGSATVTFTYARPWEKGVAPAKTAVFHVTVK